MKKGHSIEKLKQNDKVLSTKDGQRRKKNEDGRTLKVNSEQKYSHAVSESLGKKKSSISKNLFAPPLCAGLAHILLFRCGGEMIHPSTGTHLKYNSRPGWNQSSSPRHQHCHCLYDHKANSHSGPAGPSRCYSILNPKKMHCATTVVLAPTYLPFFKVRYWSLTNLTFQCFLAFTTSKRIQYNADLHKRKKTEVETNSSISLIV